MEDSKLSEQGSLYNQYGSVHVFVHVLGFLTTLLLSLPQMASLQRATVNVGTQADVPVEESTKSKYSIMLNNCIYTLCTEGSHYAHLSLEQRILAFEKECEERNHRTMEEKVYKCSI